MPVGDKPDGIIVSPFQAFCVLVETFAEIIFFSGGQIHDIETDFIRFIAFPFHTFPSHVPAIGRDDRILVISHHAFGQVDSFPVLRIIGIQIIQCKSIMTGDKINGCTVSAVLRIKIFLRQV